MNTNVSLPKDIKQLNHWNKNRQSSELSSWIKAHPERAKAVFHALYIDIHASKWLFLAPQYPGAIALYKALIPHLARLFPDAFGASCISLVSIPQSGECKDSPWVQEARLLSAYHDDESAPYPLYFAKPQASQSSFNFNAEPLHQPWSQRGLLQRLFYEKERQSREEAQSSSFISLSQLFLFRFERISCLQKQEAQAINHEFKPFHLPLSTEVSQQTGAATSVTEEETVLSLEKSFTHLFCNPTDDTQKSLSQLAKKIKTLSSLPRAYYTLLFYDLQSYWGVEMREAYLTFYQKSSSLEGLALERLLHTQSHTSDYLKAALDQENNPEKKARLAQILVQAQDSESIFSLLVTTKNPIAKSLYVSYLFEILTQKQEQGDKLPEKYLNTLFELATFPDASVRQQVAWGFYGLNALDFSLPKSSLIQISEWINQPYPELYFTALYAAEKAQQKQYVSWALAKVNDSDLTVRSAARSYVHHWGSTEDGAHLQRLAQKETGESQRQLQKIAMSLKNTSAENLPWNINTNNDMTLALEALAYDRVTVSAVITKMLSTSPDLQSEFIQHLDPFDLELKERIWEDAKTQALLQQNAGQPTPAYALLPSLLNAQNKNYTNDLDLALKQLKKPSQEARGVFFSLAKQDPEKASQHLHHIIDLKDPHREAWLLQAAQHNAVWVPHLLFLLHTPTYTRQVSFLIAQKGSPELQKKALYALSLNDESPQSIYGAYHLLASLIGSGSKAHLASVHDLYQQIFSLSENIPTEDFESESGENLYPDEALWPDTYAEALKWIAVKGIFSLEKDPADRLGTHLFDETLQPALTYYYKKLPEKLPQNPIYLEYVQSIMNK